MEVKFNVKQESVVAFLEERLIGYDKSERGRNTDAFNKVNPYGLLKDEMFFKKDCGIEVSETVKIELFDRSQETRKELINTYIYRCEKYDDIAIKLVLIDFKVELK